MDVTQGQMSARVCEALVLMMWGSLMCVACGEQPPAAVTTPPHASIEGPRAQAVEEERPALVESTHAERSAVVAAYRACLSQPATSAVANPRPTNVPVLVSDSSPFTVDIVVCTRDGEQWRNSEIVHFAVEAIVQSANGQAYAFELQRYETDTDSAHVPLGSCVGMVASGVDSSFSPALPRGAGDSLARCSFYLPGAADFFLLTHEGDQVRAFHAVIGEEDEAGPPRYIARANWSLPHDARVQVAGVP
jgi:hypothetical protein